jgi:calcium-dependent protein kinase
MLFLFLCGYPPFLGSNEVEILRKVKKGQYTMDPKDWRHISPMARDLVQKMLTVDPAKRPSAMEAYNHPWISSNNI